MRKVRQWVLMGGMVIRSGVRRTVGGEIRQHFKGPLQQRKEIGIGMDHLQGHRMADKVPRRRAGDAKVLLQAVQQTITGGVGELHP